MLCRHIQNMKPLKIIDNISIQIGAHDQSDDPSSMQLVSSLEALEPMTRQMKCDNYLIIYSSQLKIRK